MTLASSYDEVPYSSYPFSQSHPDRLATIAALFGMAAAPVDRCRVLELGCSSGGNLIPIAVQFPESQFVGVDFSRVELDQASSLVSALNLKNVELLHRNILELNADLRPFDYIIAHGVYSWVPDVVQDRILSLCSELLAPMGVAYISYNTYPGWHMRGMIRDMMSYRTAGLQRPEQELLQSSDDRRSLPRLARALGPVVRAASKRAKHRAESGQRLRAAPTAAPALRE